MFVAAAALALALTPLVRRVVLRYEIVDRPEARRVNTIPVPRGGGLAVCAAFLARRERLPPPQPTAARSCRSRSPSRRPRRRRSCSAVPWRPVLGAIDDLFDLRARYQLLGQILLACGAVALGITIDFVANPFGVGRSPSRARSLPA